MLYRNQIKRLQDKVFALLIIKTTTLVVIRTRSEITY